MEYVSRFVIGTKVVKESANKDEYWQGIIKAMNTGKALVYFPARGISRWCSIGGLFEVTVS